MDRMSWFNVDSALGQVKGWTEQVQKHVNLDMLDKLTLKDPEMEKERQKIEQEERRKERVRDSLTGILPWETRDPDRDILVEECKEAILNLSAQRETFFGPYEMPPSGILKATTPNLQNDSTNSHQEQQFNDVIPSHQPSAESLQKLKMLQPLPILLRDFDLDAHVGLINKLLQTDVHLVEMQSTHSGGGARELVFWRNYFFHCAYARYEAGLSIDEIWSDQPPVFEQSGSKDENDQDHEEEITFAEESTHSEAKAFRGELPPELDRTDDAAAAREEKDEKSGNDSSSYQIVEAGGDDLKYDNLDDGDDGDEAIDYELDELEAEIARELEN